MARLPKLPKLPKRQLSLVAVMLCGFTLAALLVYVARPGPAKRQVTRLEAATTLLDQEVLFGDLVHAQLDVLAPAGAAVHPQVNFSPFRIVNVRRDVQAVPGGQLLHFRYTLSCLVTACQVKRGLRPYLFASAQVGPVSAAWPLLTVYTRISPLTAMLGQPQPRYEQAVALTPPRPNSHALWLLGLLILAAVAGIVWLWWPEKTPEEETPADLLADALDLAGHLASAASLLRLRAALEDAAGQLEQGGKSELALRARELAWRRQQPSVDEVAALKKAVGR